MTKHHLSLCGGLAFLLAAVLVVGGCQKKAPPPKKSGPLPVPSLSRKWSVNPELKKDPISEIHVRDDTVYFYSNSGTSVGIKRETGQLEHIYAIKGGKSDLKPPVVLKEYIAYPTSTTIELFGKDGRFAKSVPLNFSIRSDAVGVGRFLYLGADVPGGGPRVIKIDVDRPYVPVIWELMSPKGGFSAAPAMVEDGIYFGGTDGWVYAVAGLTREPIWPIKDKDPVFKTAGSIVGAVAADNTGVYIASTDSTLYVLNRNSGQIRWKYIPGVPLEQGAIVTSDRVYIPVDGKGLVVLHKTDGKFLREPLWNAQDVVQYLAQDDKYSYVRGKDNSIQARDKTTGEVKFQSKRKDFTVFGVDTKDDGIIYAATKDGKLWAIKPVMQPGVLGEEVRGDMPLELEMVAMR